MVTTATNPLTAQQLDMFLDSPAGNELASTTAKTTQIKPAAPSSSFQSSTDQATSLTPTSLHTEGIEDAGQELVANRRNRGKVAATWAEIGELKNATLKVRETVKSNVWLKPDYASLIQDGMQPLVAHIVKQVYDSVAAKPVITGLATDQYLQQYITGLQRIEQGLTKWTQDKQALKGWTTQNISVTASMLGRQVNLEDLGPSTSLLEYVYPQGWRNFKDELRLVGGNKTLGALQPGYDEIKRALKAIDAGWPNKRESWEVQGFKILEQVQPIVSKSPSSSTHYVTIDRYLVESFSSEDQAQSAASVIKPFVLIGKRGYINNFDTHELAVSAAKEQTKGAKKTEKPLINSGTNVVNADRVGPSRRMEGEDISSERLMEEFGLRGVNFGNWMKTSAARAEAQLHLNHAFDAFHDLAEILDIPPKALSLGGMLGLAIGAQGHGGRNAAHFVPGVNEINLTRNTGAGALAHEWAHALDHYVARQASLDTDEEPYFSEHATLGDTKTRHELVSGKFTPVISARFPGVRPEIIQAFKAVSQAMTKRLQTPEEAQAQQAASQQRLEKNVNSWLASIGRDFKGMEPAFEKLASRVRNGDYGGEYVAVSSSTALYPVLIEMRDLYKAQHGRVYSLDPLKGLQSNLSSLAYSRSNADHQQALATEAQQRFVTTTYKNNAASLDKDKGGKPYWSTTQELFARAFDSFVADKLESKQAKNSYLSFGVRENITVPVGEERQAINAAFDNLVGELTVKETELGPALFSTGPEQGGRLPLKEIHAEIDRLRDAWKAMPAVLVVETPKDLPFRAPANADGAYHDGKVYVVAANINDMRQLQKVMAHECIMHHSLEEMLGNYGFSKLHQGVQSLKAKGDPTICAFADNVRSRYGELPPEIETKEIVARAGEECLDDKGNVRVQFGFMKGVFAGMTGWLRDHGISVPFTNAELQGILHNSGEWAKHGPDLEARQSKSFSEKILGKTSGLFIGKILGIKDGVVTQKIGRAGETMLHSMADLSAPVVPGEVVEIAYMNGKGSVKSKDRGIANAMQR